MGLSLSGRAGGGGGWALGGDLLQCWKQALLHQVSLQGVEDVELLIGTERQELLDHLAGVGAAEEEKDNTQTHILHPK